MPLLMLSMSMWNKRVIASTWLPQAMCGVTIKCGKWVLTKGIALGRRLIGNHIKTRAAQAAVFQGGDECGFIDQATATNIDDDAT